MKGVYRIVSFFPIIDSLWVKKLALNKQQKSLEKEIVISIRCLFPFINKERITSLSSESCPKNNVLTFKDYGTLTSEKNVVMVSPSITISTYQTLYFKHKSTQGFRGLVFDYIQCFYRPKLLNNNFQFLDNQCQT